MISPAPHRSVRPWVDAALVLALLAIAAAVRFPDLGRHGYELDEMWTAEVSVGRGSPHVTLPTDVLLDPPPRLAWPADRPPAWAVWSHLALTHPPLYSVGLRLWQDLFGPGDANERAFSAAASVAAVGLLYAAVRQRAGPVVAGCAGLLLAVSVPQVQYARLTRGYALETALAVGMAVAVGRVEMAGPTRRRTVLLAVVTAALLLTHYFAVAAVAAVGAYAVVVLRGRTRRSVLVGLSVGAAVFAVAWGPFFPAQWHLLAAADPATDFLRHDRPGHVGWTLWRAALTPLTMLFPQPPGQARVAVIGAVLFLAPLAGRRYPGVTFWGVWLVAVVGLLTGLDLTRGTTHLAYIRYPILAGPAVCALVPMATAAVLPRRAWVACVVTAAAAAGCLLSRADAVDDPDRAGVAEVVAAVRPPLSAADVVVFAAPPAEAQFAGGQYLLFDRYMGPVPCPVAILTGPAPAAVLARIAVARRAWVFTGVADWRPYLPGVVAAGPAKLFPKLGTLTPVRVR